jgi:3-oxoisoapionate decarboxylase
MKLGVSTWAYTWSFGWAGKVPSHPMDAFTLVETAARLGARVVQIADNLPLDALPPAERARLKALADSLNIAIEVGTYGIADEKIETYIGIAREFGSPILRTVTGIDKHKSQPDELIARLRRLLGRLEKAKVILAIENHDLFTAEALAAIVATIDSPCVGICMDTSNSFGALEDPDRVTDVLGPLAVNVHLKDITIERLPDTDLGFYVVGAEPGVGRLNIDLLVKRLREFGRDPNVIIEQWVPPEATIDETAAKEQAWAERGFRRLRKLIPD